MTDEWMIRRQEELLATEVDGEMVALHVEKGTCYGFNATATRIWALLEEPRSFGEIRDTLVAEYDVDPEACEQQILDLLKDLEADGLVSIEPATTPNA